MFCSQAFPGKGCWWGGLPGALCRNCVWIFRCDHLVNLCSFGATFHTVMFVSLMPWRIDFFGFRFREILVLLLWGPRRRWMMFYVFNSLATVLTLCAAFRRLPTGPYVIPRLWTSQKRFSILFNHIFFIHRLLLGKCNTVLLPIHCYISFTLEEGRNRRRKRAEE